MIADIFTKPVDEETFVFCKHEIRNMPHEPHATQRAGRIKAAHEGICTAGHTRDM